MSTLEIDITENCNLRCTACSRSCGSAPSTDMMTVEQIKKFVEESIVLRWKWRSIMIIGGEPTLHPQLLDIIDALKRYKEYNDKCRIKLMTNGSSVAEKVLSKIPAWMEVINNSSNKLRKDQGHKMPFNVAPIDVGAWDEGSLTKCGRLFWCGMGLTRDGYFACHVSGGIQRVFGMDYGIKDLKDVTFKALDKTFTLSCRYCGVYLESSGLYKKYDVNLITNSWENAYKKYNEGKKKPA